MSTDVLVLAPHPDDESLGCGGTIRLLTESGIHVDVVFMTRGEHGCEAPEASTPGSRRELAATRTREAQQACQILGVAEVHFLEGTDANLACEAHMTQRLVSWFRERSYQRVFCPWPGDRHIDHAATHAHLLQALKTVPKPVTLWLYEVWTPLPHNICIPIDATMEIKRSAVRAHESQLACIDYLSAFEGLASYRALFCPGSRYAEAFQIVPGQERDR